MAYLDGQLAPKEMAAVADHVSRCSGCARRLEALDTERAKITSILEPYRAAVEGAARPAVAAGGGKPFPTGKQGSPVTGGIDNLLTRKGVLWQMKRYQRALATVAVAAVVVGLFSYGPVRSFAAQVLRVFRVNQVQIVHFNPADVQELEKALQTYGKNMDIASFGEIERAENKDFSRLDADTVNIAGQSVSLPEQLGSFSAAGGLRVEPGERLSVKPRVEGINGFLSSLGSRRLMPRELDGKTFTVVIPPVAAKPYRAGSTDFTLFRSVSPEFSVPEGVDVAQVRAALLDIPILPERMKNTLAGIDPFGSTLLIPDFGTAQNGTVKEVLVNGVKGVFMIPGNTGGDVSSSHRVLIWPQGTVWNALEGSFELDQAREIAKCVK
ncbi:MAG: zf-HC2 domain-containing protein [Bacillota bacterium]